MTGPPAFRTAESVVQHSVLVGVHNGFPLEACGVAWQRNVVKSFQSAPKVLRTLDPPSDPPVNPASACAPFSPRASNDRSWADVPVFLPFRTSNAIFVSSDGSPGQTPSSLKHERFCVEFAPDLPMKRGKLLSEHLKGVR